MPRLPSGRQSMPRTTWGSQVSSSSIPASRSGGVRCRESSDVSSDILRSSSSVSYIWSSCSVGSAGTGLGRAEAGGWLWSATGRGNPCHSHHAELRKRDARRLMGKAQRAAAGRGRSWWRLGRGCRTGRRCAASCSCSHRHPVGVPAPRAPARPRVLPPALPRPSARFQVRPHRRHPLPPRHLGQQWAETSATAAISCLTSKSRTRGAERERPLR